MSMVWPTLGSTTAKEQNRTVVVVVVVVAPSASGGLEAVESVGAVDSVERTAVDDERVGDSALSATDEDACDHDHVQYESHSTIYLLNY